MTIELDAEFETRFDKMTEDEIDIALIVLNLRLMVLIMQKKIEEGKMVFNAIEGGLMN